RRVVGDAMYAQAGGRINDAVVEAQLIQPVVEKSRHHRGGAVERVGRLPAPEAFHADVARAALGWCQLEGIGNAALCLKEPVGAQVADRLAHSLGEYRRVLDPVPVAVYDGMLEVLSDFLGCAMRAHLAPPERYGCDDTGRDYAPRLSKSNLAQARNGLPGRE